MLDKNGVIAQTSLEREESGADTTGESAARQLLAEVFSQRTCTKPEQGERLSLASGAQEKGNSLCLLSLCDARQAGDNWTALKQRVYGLITQLDSNSFREREAAHRTLMSMDRSILPLLERELRNPRSAEVAARLRLIYRELSGCDRVQFDGDTGRDGLGRLREIRDNMAVSYANGAVPSRESPVDSIHYQRAGGWSVIRQADGTYNIYQDSNDGQAMESGVRLTLDQRTGAVRAVLQDGSVMIIPPAGPRWWYRERSDPPPPPQK